MKIYLQTYQRVLKLYASKRSVVIKKECSNQIVNKVSFFNNRQILSSIVLPEKNLNYW